MNNPYIVQIDGCVYRIVAFYDTARTVPVYRCYFCGHWFHGAPR